MTITVLGDNKRVLVGAPSFLFSFYSTIVCNIANYQQYKVSVKFLGSGKILADDCDTAAKELEQIRQDLKRFPPDRVVWDMNHKEKLPPWGNNISPHIDSLGNYFVTADGKDLFDELISLLKYAAQHHFNVAIEP